MAKVTGIGGVFFKATKDQAALTAWYQEVLGVETEPWGGAIFSWEKGKGDDGGLTVWNTAEPGSEWFAPSQGSFMINYRVDDMEGMIARLQKAGVAILQGPESHENGKFLWLMDPEGNKVELWEPALWQDA